MHDVDLENEVVDLKNEVVHRFVVSPKQYQLSPNCAIL